MLALVDVSFFPQSVPEVLDRHCVLWLCGPDVGGIADIGGVKEFTEPLGDLVAQLDLRDACFLCCLLDLVIQWVCQLRTDLRRIVPWVSAFSLIGYQPSDHVRLCQCSAELSCL